MGKKVGRPSKLTEKFIDIAREIIDNDDDLNAIILTDEELLIAINGKLTREERVTDRTLQRWKASKNPDRLSEPGRNFVVLIKKALVKQKQYLFKRLINDNKTWQKYAWIIERKFDDWNIRHKADHIIKDEQRPIPILGGVLNVLSYKNDQKDIES